MSIDRRVFLNRAITASIVAPFVYSSSAEAYTLATTATASRLGLRVLAFDTFGTVVDWRSSVIAEGRRMGAEKGLSVDWPAFADAWRDGYSPSMERVRRGELPWTKLDVLHRMTLDELLPRFNVSGLSEDERTAFNHVWHRLRPWPDSVAGLQRMRRLFTLTTLSNGNVGLLTDMAKHAQLPWDCILSAEIVRHYKPDPETYQLVPDIFDLKPAEVLMVACHESDLEAAQKVGLRTAFIYRPLEYGAGKAAVLPTAGRFDIIARNFHDLATRLGA